MWESDLAVRKGRAGVQWGKQRPGQMRQVVHGQVTVDVGVEVESRVSWTFVQNWTKELMRCGVQVPRRQSGGAQSCCTAIYTALVTHVTLARVLHLLHLNKEHTHKKKKKPTLYNFICLLFTPQHSCIFFFLLMGQNVLIDYYYSSAAHSEP